MTTIESIKHGVNFTFDSFIDSRNAVRLLNSGCQWFQHFSGKATFAIGSCTLNTEVLSKKFLKPLNDQIGFVNGIKGILTLDKCAQAWRDSRYGDFGKHLTKTCADNLGGLKYLAACGFVVLTPYIGQLAIAKATFGVAAALFEIALRISDLFEAQRISGHYWGGCTQDQFNNLKGRVMGDILMIGVQVCSFALNAFVLSNALDVYRVSSLGFNIAGTLASFSGVGYSLVKYNTSNTH